MCDNIPRAAVRMRTSASIVTNHAEALQGDPKTVM
jgi:hypothetical protein